MNYCPNCGKPINDAAKSQSRAYYDPSAVELSNAMGITPDEVYKIMHGVYLGVKPYLTEIKEVLPKTARVEIEPLCSRLALGVVFTIWSSVLDSWTTIRLAYNAKTEELEFGGGSQLGKAPLLSMRSSKIKHPLKGTSTSIVTNLVDDLVDLFKGNIRTFKSHFIDFKSSFPTLDEIKISGSTKNPKHGVDAYVYIESFEGKPALVVSYPSYGGGEKLEDSPAGRTSEVKELLNGIRSLQFLGVLGKLVDIETGETEDEDYGYYCKAYYEIKSHLGYSSNLESLPLNITKISNVKTFFRKLEKFI